MTASDDTPFTTTRHDDLQSLVWFDSSKLLIDGQWRNAASGETLPIEDPSTGAIIGAIAHGGAADVDAAVTAARAAASTATGAA